MELPQTANISIEIIGYVTSCFTEKFAVPRQPGLTPSASARLRMVPPFNRKEMVRGLETFSHIWVQFLFHAASAEGWKPTVRPPRLGGTARRGVWATRSPHRPNFIGLSAVRLVEVDVSEGVELVLGGIDLLDGTPVIDIKPYLPESDRMEGASDGWSAEPFAELVVQFSAEAADFCRTYEQSTGSPLCSLITEVLQTDPRPASQRNRREEFGMLLWDVNVRWRTEGDVCRVLYCERR